MRKAFLRISILSLLTLSVSVFPVAAYASFSDTVKESTVTTFQSFGKGFFDIGIVAKKAGNQTASVWDSIKNLFAPKRQNQEPVGQPQLQETPALKQEQTSDISNVPPSAYLRVETPVAPVPQTRAAISQLTNTFSSPQVTQQILNGVPRYEFERRIAEVLRAGQMYADTRTSSLTGGYTVPPSINLQNLTNVQSITSTSGTFTNLSVTGNTNVSGTVTATTFIGDGSQLTGIVSGGSSQWTDSGSDIYFNSGKVGIGTSNPSNSLDIVDGANGTAGINIATYGTGVFGTPHTNLTLMSSRGTPSSVSNIQQGDDVGMLNFYGQTSSGFELGAAIGAVASANYTGSNAPTDLYFITNKSERARLSSSGNFGIGTTTPDTLLTVNGSARFNVPNSNDGIFGKDLSNNNLFSLTRQGVDTSLTSYASIGFAANKPAGPSTSYDMFITNGNVGIGTTSPYAKLSVAGTVVGQNFVATSTTDRSTFGAASFGLNGENIGIRTTNPLTAFHLKQRCENNYTCGLSLNRQDNNGSWTFLMDGGSGFNLGYTSDGSSYSDILKFTSTGNVGIGTTNPLSKLSVDGTTNITGTLTLGAGLANRSAIEFTTPNYGIGIDGTDLVFYSNTAPTVGFSFKNNSYNGDTVMRIMSGGNVGIGTTIPSNKLDVNGAVVIGSTFSGNATAAPINSLAVEGQLGLGVLNPKNKVDVKGNTVIGSSYAGVATAPANGLLIEGNVGIGTTNPQAKLQVRAAADRNIWFRQNGGGQSDISSIDDAISAYTPLSINGSYLGLNNGTDGTIFTGNGNFGIGTTSPYAKLSVAGTVVGQNFVGTSTSASSFAGNVGFGVTNPTNKIELGSGGKIKFYDETGDKIYLYSNLYGLGIESGELAIWSQQNTVFRKNGIAGPETMRIDTNGKVGIGALLPAAKLTVGSANSLTTSDLMFVYNGADSSYRNGIANVFDGNNLTNNKMSFLVSDATATGQVNVMTLVGNGSVGIGTTSPSNPLDVAGRIRAYAASGNVGISVHYMGSSGREYQFLSCSGCGTASVGGLEVYDATASAGRAYIQAGVNGWQTPSDRRLKDNIQTLTVLDRIDKVRGASYVLRDSGIPQIGVIAQEIREAFPEAVSGVESEGTYLGVSYDAISAIALQGVKELNIKIEKFEPTSQSFKDTIIAWFGDRMNGIQHFFANTTHQKTLCVGDENGETCITKSQLDSLLQQAGTPAAAAAVDSPVPPPADEPNEEVQEQPQQEASPAEPAAPVEPAPTPDSGIAPTE